MMQQLGNDAAGKLLLRLTVGGLMLFHGASKLMHPGSVDFIGGKLTESGLPALLAYGVYVGEIIAPLMLILGILSRVGGLLVVTSIVMLDKLRIDDPVGAISVHVVKDSALNFSWWCRRWWRGRRWSRRGSWSLETIEVRGRNEPILVVVVPAGSDAAKARN